MNEKSNFDSSVHQFFELSPNKRYYVCQYQIQGSNKLCGAHICAYTKNGLANKTWHLKRHLKSHSHTFKKSNSKGGTNNAAQSKLRNKARKRASVKTMKQRGKITIAMTADKFKKHLIEMVVKDDVSLTFFSQPSFHGLIEEIASNFQVILKEQDIKHLVVSEATYKKERLKQTLKGKSMFLKIDTIACNAVDYFAINTRFVSDTGEIMTNTFAVKTSKTQNFSTYLQHWIDEILEEFELNRDQILAIFSDNASNKIIAAGNRKESFIIEEELPNPPGCGMSEVDHPSEALDFYINEALTLCSIHHRLSAGRIFQLALRDGLKKPHMASILSMIRQIAMALRTYEIHKILQDQAGKGVVIFGKVACVESAYTTIKQLLELKSVLEKIDDQIIATIHNLWNDIIILEAILSHPYMVLKKLQTEDLTAGEFLWEWKNVIFQLSHINGPMSEGILSSMLRREPQLLQNVFFVTSVYVDPKNRILLTDEQIMRSKRTLCNLAMKLKGLLDEKFEKLNTDFGVIQSNVKAEISSEPPTKLDFNEYLDKIEKVKVDKTKSESTEDNDQQLVKFQTDFCTALNTVEEYDRSCQIPLTDLVQTYPEITREAIRMVMAYPASRVSFETLISAVQFIRSEASALMEEEVANAILFLKTNK